MCSGWEITWEAAVMISWWEMGPKELCSAARQEVLFMQGSQGKRMNSHRVAGVAAKQEEHAWDANPKWNLVPSETEPLLSHWCLVSDSAISKSPSKLGPSKQPHPRGEVLLKLWVAGEVRCKSSCHVLTLHCTDTLHLSFFICKLWLVLQVPLIANHLISVMPKVWVKQNQIIL